MLTCMYSVQTTTSMHSLSASKCSSCLAIESLLRPDQPPRVTCCSCLEICALKHYCSVHSEQCACLPKTPVNLLCWLTFHLHQTHQKHNISRHVTVSICSLTHSPLLPPSPPPPTHTKLQHATAQHPLQRGVPRHHRPTSVGPQPQVCQGPNGVTVVGLSGAFGAAAAAAEQLPHGAWGLQVLCLMVKQHKLITVNMQQQILAAQHSAVQGSSNYPPPHLHQVKACVLCCCAGSTWRPLW
jgi:hypothetical protein